MLTVFGSSRADDRDGQQQKHRGETASVMIIEVVVEAAIVVVMVAVGVVLLVILVHDCSGDDDG